MADVIPMMQAERKLLDEYLVTLTPEQFAAQSWCHKWTVQDLVAHLTAAGHVTAGHFFGTLIRNGFSFDKFVEGDVEQYNKGTPADVLANYEKIVDSPRTPPGPKYVGLGEVMVHGEDIRRPLGARGEHPEEHLVTLANLYKKTGWPLYAKKRLSGLRLTATDVDFTTGDGPDIKGPCMSLILAMVGRAQALDDCEGEGVATLRERGRTAT